MNLMGTFNFVGDSNSDNGGLLPLMQQMMQNVLSKEILYPPLSSILEKVNNQNAFFE